MKIFGITLSKDKKTTNVVPSTRVRGKVSNTIKKQYRRDVSWQIKDIRMAEMLARNPNLPNRRRLFEIYYYVLKDLRLKGQLRDAIMKVTGEPWMFYDENENLQEDLSRQMRKEWMTQIIKWIAYVEFWGYSVLEFDGLKPETFDIDTITLLPREHISIEWQQILIMAEVGSSSIDYSDIMWDLDIIEFFDTREDLGMLNEIAYNTIWKYYSRSDWSRASEKFGMPLLSIIADTNNDNELDRLENKAADFGTDGYVVAQKGDTVSIIERAGQRIHDIYLDSINLSNNENELGINGQLATSQEKAFVGSAEVQERKFEDLTLTRLEFVKNQINKNLLPYLRVKGFAIPENFVFDYPALINDREQKLNPKQNQPVSANTDANGIPQPEPEPINSQNPPSED